MNRTEQWKIGNRLKVASYFTNNGSNMTPLLLKSNLPTTASFLRLKPSDQWLAQPHPYSSHFTQLAVTTSNPLLCSALPALLAGVAHVPECTMLSFPSPKLGWIKVLCEDDVRNYPRETYMINPFLHLKGLWITLTGLRPLYYDLPEVKNCWIFKKSVFKFLYQL